MKLSELKFDGSDNYSDDNISIFNHVLIIDYDFAIISNMNFTFSEMHKFTLTRCKRYYIINTDILCLELSLEILKSFVRYYQRYLRKEKIIYFI